MFVDIHSRLVEFFVAPLQCHCPTDSYRKSVLYAIHTDHENGVYEELNSKR